MSLREAELADAPFLAELWTDSLRKADGSDQQADVEQLIKAAMASSEQRIVVAEYDGERAGAVLLRMGPLTPLNMELAVAVLAPRVVPAFRRHGIGRLLMESGTAFAEENGIAMISTAVAAGSRDGNRFMARLAFGPNATLRVAPVAAVRGRLNAQRPAMQSTPASGRQLTRVLAARRSMRRATQSAG